LGYDEGRRKEGRIVPQDEAGGKAAGWPQPRVGEPHCVHGNPFYTIDKVTADFGDHTRDYYVSRDGVRAGVVAVRDGLVLLVRQYRLLIDGYSLEIPGGALSPGETPEEAASRECLEESGLGCGELHHLVTYLLALDIRDNPTHIFFCHDFASEDIPEADARESVGHEWVPLQDCLRMIFSGQITDSFSIIALLAYWAKWSGEAPKTGLQV
jgi:8-oxo-dGTP pyrophosphatase MutT (NUDIX family)